MTPGSHVEYLEDILIRLILSTHLQRAYSEASPFLAPMKLFGECT